MSIQSPLIQPINFQPVATADATGSASWLFDAVSLSNTWEGVLNCSSAPDTARFTAFTGASTFGTFKGSNNYGPLQLQGGDRLQVSAVGLVPGVQYQMSFQGANNVVGEPQQLWPNAYADTVTSSTQQVALGSLANTSVSTGFVTLATVTLQPLWRSLYIVYTWKYASGTPTVTPQVTGNQSGISYTPVQVPWYNFNAGLPGVQNSQMWRIPITAGIDTSVTVQLGVIGSLTTLNSWWGADLATNDMGVFADEPFNVITQGSSVVETAVFGGFLTAAINLPTAGSTVSILAAPATGKTYALKSASLLGFAANATVNIGSGGGFNYAVLTVPYHTSYNFGGLLARTLINATPSTTSAGQYLYLTYDLVGIPTIS